MFLLYETASGYCLFEKEEYDSTGGGLAKVQKAVGELERFSKMVSLAAYQPFTTAEEALDNIMQTIDVKVSTTLQNFLTTHLPTTKTGKKQKFALGISEPHLGKRIHEATGITASYDDTIVELLRGVRQHFTSLTKSKYWWKKTLQKYFVDSI